MALSDHKGNQITTDTIQKYFLRDFLTVFILFHILGLQQCKIIMALSDHKGNQITTDTIQKCFLRDF
jgi:hypothetical protein